MKKAFKTRFTDRLTAVLPRGEGREAKGTNAPRQQFVEGAKICERCDYNGLRFKKQIFTTLREERQFIEGAKTLECEFIIESQGIEGAWHWIGTTNYRCTFTLNRQSTSTVSNRRHFIY